MLTMDKYKNSPRRLDSLQYVQQQAFDFAPRLGFDKETQNFMRHMKIANVLFDEDTHGYKDAATDKELKIHSSNAANLNGRYSPTGDKNLDSYIDEVIEFGKKEAAVMLGPDLVGDRV